MVKECHSGTIAKGSSSESLGPQCEVVQATAATKGDEQSQEVLGSHSSLGRWMDALCSACPRLQCAQQGTPAAWQVSRQW